MRLYESTLENAVLGGCDVPARVHLGDRRQDLVGCGAILSARGRSVGSDLLRAKRREPRTSKASKCVDTRRPGTPCANPRGPGGRAGTAPWPAALAVLPGGCGLRPEVRCEPGAGYESCLPRCLPHGR